MTSADSLGAPTPTALNVASTLCWLTGIVQVFTSLLVNTPRGGLYMLPDHLPILTVVGVGLGLAGFGLRRRRRWAGVLAIACILAVFAFGSFILPQSLVGVVVYGAVAVIVVRYWRQLA